MPDSKDDGESPIESPIDSRRNYFDVSVANSICEAIDIPKVLYRAISVSPEAINKDFFDAPLRTNAEGTSNTQ